MTAFTVTSVTISMPLTEEQWERLLAFDRVAVDNDTEELSTLVDKMNDIWDCDYNGHFGAQIVLCAKTANAAESACNSIRRLLEEWRERTDGI